MTEQRKHPRKPLGRGFKLWERNSRQVLGYLADISPEGIMLVSGTSVELGAIVQCTLELPEEVNGTREITLDAQSLWCHGDDDTRVYRIGLQLLEVPAEDRETIQRLLQEYVIHS